MKFLANVSKLRENLKPVIDVATKGAIKDWEDSFRITFNATNDELKASSFGGRLAISLSMTDVISPELEYDCSEEGSVTVSAIDVARNLEAFPPGGNVIIAANEKEFVITDSVDPDQLQAQPVFEESVSIPSLSKSFFKEVEVSKDAFVTGFNKVAYAIGFEKNKEQYLYWKLDCSKDSLRFASGTGGRFAVYDVSGNHIVKTNNDLSFLFPKEQSPVVSGILDRVNDNNVKIKQASRTEDVPDQIIFEVNAFSLMLVGFDPDISWPKIDGLLSAGKKVRVETNAKDWEYATKGLMATFNEDLRKEHDTHESDLVLHLKNSVISLNTKKTMRAARKVPIVDVKETDSSFDGMSFRCTTPYISEIFSKSEKGDSIELAFIDNDKPIFVYWPEKTNASSGVKEQFTSFFASLKD